MQDASAAPALNTELIVTRKGRRRLVATPESV